MDQDRLQPYAEKEQDLWGEGRGRVHIHRGRGQLGENEIFLSTLTGNISHAHIRTHTHTHTVFTVPHAHRDRSINIITTWVECTKMTMSLTIRWSASVLPLAAHCHWLAYNVESDQLLEDALGSGQCLFGVSTSAGAHCYPMHRFYRLMGGAEGRGVVGGWG